MLIAHIVFRFDYGGLENGLVNVINGTNCNDCRHVVIALSEATDFAERLQGRAQVFALHKKPGKDFGAYWRLYKLLRELKPDIVHTRNIGTMDCAFIAWLARVPVRIHGEHGWDIFDPDGTNPKYRLMRRVLSRFIHRFVTVSADLRRWLIDVVGLPADRIQHICNGVDTDRFHPRNDDRELTDVVIGSVTRFSPIKDPLNLARAFCVVRRSVKSGRLLMVGDGELREEALHMLAADGLSDDIELPGSRDDVAEQLQKMDVFVLGSLREGISNTILEAMASGPAGNRQQYRRQSRIDRTRRERDVGAARRQPRAFRGDSRLS